MHEHLIVLSALFRWKYLSDTSSGLSCEMVASKLSSFCFGHEILKSTIESLFIFHGTHQYVKPNGLLSLMQQMGWSWSNRCNTINYRLSGKSCGPRLFPPSPHSTQPVTKVQQQLMLQELCRAENIDPAEIIELSSLSIWRGDSFDGFSSSDDFQSNSPSENCSSHQLQSDLNISENTLSVFRSIESISICEKS